MKICFTASSGGHLEEIMQLKEIAQLYDSFLITEKNEFQNCKMCKKKYFVRKTDRKEKLFLLHYLSVFKNTYFIIKREKPNLIISTGALITFPVCLWGRMRGAKVIYIESFARVSTLSLTGKFMRKIADLYIVQSETLLKYCPEAVYVGSLF